MVSCAKNCRAVYFKPGYVNADGDITNYCLDILMNLSDRWNCIVGSKGLAALNVPFNMQWLRSWYEDINQVQVDADYLRLWAVTSLVPGIPLPLFQLPENVRFILPSS